MEGRKERLRRGDCEGRKDCDNPWGTVDLAEVFLAAKLPADHFHVLEALALLEVADVPDLRK